MVVYLGHARVDTQRELVEKDGFCFVVRNAGERESRVRFKGRANRCGSPQPVAVVCRMEPCHILLFPLQSRDFEG